MLALLPELSAIAVALPDELRFRPSGWPLV
jgi:hypothetical protein